MTKKSRKLWARALMLSMAGGFLLQQGCAVDPDLLLQAGVQVFTEFAIFVTDSAIVGLR